MNHLNPGFLRIDLGLPAVLGRLPVPELDCDEAELKDEAPAKREPPTAELGAV